ncbi:hypothetical protein MPTK1_6g15340 [Marchantia polymorpha subsp. ruderalis]|uniref:Rab-GAP TBC domain-containing protein n=2 Tax=Marchantia polymorpha TaxID=3197 RepID=A0AAF6BSA7_MARPO|nr:hypothetical protein MARPO_0056s0046 [Marchantia polymorpha]BBN14891.1 hypothetical protein Mp_6g15340 [Marchantia polymorpha subsp. ruderalis]|eukprot:PTQ37575.1 hypothetical protein MARPO_0056s0046 [Marchantia polymorpha]
MFKMSALGRLGRRVSEDLDGHYTIRPDVPEAPPSRFRPKLGKRLSPRAWHAAFNKSNQLDLAKVITRIQRGGIDPSIRAEVWEFLLGAFPPDSTNEARTTLRLQRRKEYAKLKETCQAMDSAVGSGEVVTLPRIDEDEVKPKKDEGIRRRQTKKHRDDESGSSDLEQTNGNENAAMDDSVKNWKLILHQIGLDVVRTDRMLQFYEVPQNQARLWDILALYAWYDQEIGYCQGMSDLCSPLVVLYTDDADAFWVFERIMARVRANFLCTEKAVGVQKQLENLASIMKLMDPKLHQHLEQLGGGNYIFSFRMVMVLFRREFSFADTLYLWEMMWASEFVPASPKDWKSSKTYSWSGKFGKQLLKIGTTKDPGSNAPMAVFCMGAIFEMQRTRLLKETQGLDDVVKLLNEITGKVDPKVACKKAVKLHRAYLHKVGKVN